MYFPGRFPVFLFLAPLLCLTPHAVALRWKSLAGVMWIGGAAMTALMSLGIPSPLEAVCFFGLLVLPWTLAAYWIFSARGEG